MTLSEYVDFITRTAAGAPGGERTSLWDGFVFQISEDAKLVSPAHFLRWPSILFSMHMTQSALHDRWFRALQADARWVELWFHGTRELPLGDPVLFSGDTGTSPQKIQMNFHLLEMTRAFGFTPLRMAEITEFGGGYGLMANTLRTLRFMGAITVYDLVPFSFLQEAYLNEGGIATVRDSGNGDVVPGAVRLVSSDRTFGAALEGVGRSGSLFISTWALSETPIAVRDEVVAALERFQYIFIAFQGSIVGIDNLAYFLGVSKTLIAAGYAVTLKPVAGMEADFYLLASRGDGEDGGRA